MVFGLSRIQAVFQFSSLVLTLCIGDVLLGWSQPETQASEQRPVTAHSDLAQDAVPTLRSTTRLVQLNVVVNDKHGNPISGLRREDFTLLVDKKPKHIQVFSVEKSDLSPAHSTVSASPDVYRNTVQPRVGSSGNVTVILLDQLNTEVADQIFAREALIQFLKRIQLQDHVALYCLASDLRVLEDFDADPFRLYEAAARLREGSSQKLADSKPEDPSLDNANSSLRYGQTSDRERFRKTFAQRAANESVADRVRQTAAAFVAIANHVGSLPGRKNLVWISDSFPLRVGNDKFDADWASDTGADFGNEVEKAARALTNANIAVYPIDARGLIGPDVAATEATRQDDEGRSVNDPAEESFDTMNALAERTGGRAFHNTNNLSGAIRRALDDSRVNYTLGYYPVSLKWDGSFHRLQVKVNVPGAEVHSRTGFFAFPDPPRLNDIQSTIEQTALGKLAATGIGLRVQVQSAREPWPQTLIAKLAFELNEIQIQAKGKDWTGSVETAFLQLNERGEVIGKDDKTVAMKFGPPEYEEKPTGEVTTTEKIRILPSTAQLCVVVRDNSSRQFGSVLIPIEKYFPSQALR